MPVVRTFPFTLIILLATIIPLQAVESYWKDYYDMAVTREEALATPLDSTDAMALKRSAVYFHTVVNNLETVKPERRRREKSDNSELSIQYITAAYNLDKSNTMITSWMAAITCSHANAVMALWPKKIRILRSGIEIFSTIPREERQNLDFLFIQTIIYSAVPLIIEDLTAIVIENVDSWLKLYYETKNPPVRHKTRLEDMKVFKTKALFDSGNRVTARELLSGIDSYRLSTENNTMSIETLSIYEKLKSRLRVQS